MIKTPLSTVLGGAFWTPGATVINGAKLSFEIVMKKLFANGEQGFYYDPNDLSTMYQDAAGTVPVTAVGQPVGLIKDKSGRNNHAYQTVSASRPVLSARVNLINSSEQLNVSSWLKSRVTATNNIVTADASTGNHIIYQSFSYTKPATVMKLRAEFGKSTGFAFMQLCLGNENRLKCTLNLDTGQFVESSIGAITGKCSVTWSNSAWVVTITGKNPTVVTSYANFGFATSLSGDTVNTYGEPLFTATGAETFAVSKIDLREESFTEGFPEYQKVNSDGTHSSEGFTKYLAFDGVDDFLVTSSIDFTTTDKISLFAGVRKLSDAGNQVIVELSSNMDTLGRAFKLSTDSDGSTYFVTRATSSSFVGRIDKSPVNLTFAGNSSFSPPSVSLKVSGKTLPAKTSSMGEGNYGNYPLYIGRRGGTSLPFNGRIYGLIGIGRLTNTEEIAIIEKELAKRTGVTLNV